MTAETIKIMKDKAENSRGSGKDAPMIRDTLLITDADTKVKRRVPKYLLGCSMRRLHNELIASPEDGSLLGARHAIKIM